MIKTMKSFVFISLLFIFVLFSVFGAFSLANMGENGEDCWAAAAFGVDCKDMNSLASFNFHSGALAKFSSAIFQNIFLLVLVPAVLFIVSRKIPAKAPVAISRINFSHRNKELKLNQNKFTRWLSLFENSPSYSK